MIDNPGEPKYRSFKRENKRAKDLLTGCKPGEQLLSLVGFILIDSHPDFTDVKVSRAEHVYRLAPGIDIQYIKGAKLEL